MTFYCCPCLWLRNHKPQPLGVVEGLFQLVLGSAEAAPSKITSPAVTSAKSRSLKKGFFPPFETLKGQVPWFRKFTPTLMAIFHHIFMEKYWKIGFLHVPSKPKQHLLHLRRSGHTTAL